MDTSPAPPPDVSADDLEEIDDGDTIWRFDRSFLESNWTCIWGRGCLGILDEPAEHLGQGCCSVGAELGDEDEARMISARWPPCSSPSASSTTPRRRPAASSATTRGPTPASSTAPASSSTVPGFAGGAGCALHLAALDAGESPIDWKPSVCWQLPIQVDWAAAGDGTRDGDRAPLVAAPTGATRARRWRGAAPRATGPTSATAR